MRHLVLLVKVVAVAAFDLVLLSIVGREVTDLYWRVAPSGVFWELLMYVFGLALAVGAPVYAARVAASGQRLHWAKRTTLITVPVFLCPSLVIAGSPGFHPVPMFGGLFLCLVCAVAAFWLSRPSRIGASGVSAA